MPSRKPHTHESSQSVIVKLIACSGNDRRDGHLMQRPPAELIEVDRQRPVDR